nr:immunoglobulin heavy chain junction region [Mus musculus]
CGREGRDGLFDYW